MMRGLIKTAAATSFVGTCLVLALIPFVLPAIFWALSHLFWLMDTLVGQPHPLP